MSGRGKEAPDRTRQRRLGDQAFKEYSEEQLERIAQSLASVLRIPAGNKALRPAGKKALREVLRRRIQWHAKRYLMGAYLHHAPDSPLRLKPLADRRPTPKLRKEIAVTDAAIRVLGNCETLYKDRELPDHLRISLRATLDLLKAERPKLQQRHDASAVDQGGQRDRCGNSNARQVYTEFWTLLTEAWLAIVPAATTQLCWQKHLGRFLFACSKPVFPEGTTENALEAFIDRYSRKRQSKVAGV